MSKSDILETLINHYCDGNKAKFAAMIGISPPVLSNWIKRNTIDYEVVYKGCPRLSGDWLLSGEGSIERNDSQTDNSQSDNCELLSLCKLLVANYQQRDEIMSRLVVMIQNK